LFISDGTCKSWLDHYQNGGLEELLKNRHEGNHFKLSSVQLQAISRYVDTYNVLSSSQVCAYVKRKYGVSYSENGMTQLLKRLDFSYRKPISRPSKLNRRSQRAFVKRFNKQMTDLKDDEVIYFQDAAGFVHNSKMDYGWQRKGRSKQVKSNSGRQKVNVNGVINAISQDIITVRQKENINTKSNIALVEEIIRQNQDKSKIILILDNAPMNRSYDFIQFIKKQKIRIELMYLPVYSPNLNLIERLWRFAKRKVLSNRYYSSFARFKEVIDDFFENKVHKQKKELKKLMHPKFQLY